MCLVIVAYRDLECTKETLIKFRVDAAAGVGEGFGGFGGGRGEETKNEEEDVCIIYIVHFNLIVKSLLATACLNNVQ